MGLTLQQLFRPQAQSETKPPAWQAGDEHFTFLGGRSYRNLNPAPNGVIDGLDDRIGKAHFGEQALRDQTFGMKGQYCV
jgi:hypothetical protein